MNNFYLVVVPNQKITVVKTDKELTQEELVNLLVRCDSRSAELIMVSSSQPKIFDIGIATQSTYIESDYIDRRFYVSSDIDKELIRSNHRTDWNASAVYPIPELNADTIGICLKGHVRVSNGAVYIGEQAIAVGFYKSVILQSNGEVREFKTMGHTDGMNLYDLSNSNYFLQLKKNSRAFKDMYGEILSISQ